MERDEEAVAAALRALAAQPLPGAELNATAIWRLAQARRALAAQARKTRESDMMAWLTIALAAVAAMILAWRGMAAHALAFGVVGTVCLAVGAAALAMLRVVAIREHRWYAMAPW